MRRARKRLVALVLGVVLLGVVVVAAAFGDLGDSELDEDVALLVEGAPDGEVPVDEIQPRIDELIQQQEQQLGTEISSDDPAYRQLVSQVLESPILVRWLVGEAEDRNVLITDEEVGQFIAQNGGAQVVQQQLEAQGVFATDVELAVRAVLAQNKMLNQVIERPDIPEEELEAAYDELRELALSDPTQTQAQQIVGYTPAERDVRQVVNPDEAEVEAALAKLEQDDSDESWKRVAKQYSTDPVTRETGGLRRGVADPAAAEALGAPAGEVEQEIFAAPEEELVGPFEANGEFYAIQVIEARGEDFASFDEARPQVEQALTGQEQGNAQQRFLDALIAKWTPRTFCGEDYLESARCANGEPTDDGCPVDDSAEREQILAQESSQIPPAGGDLETQLAAGCEALVPSRAVVAPTDTGAFALPLAQAPVLPPSPAKLVAEALTADPTQGGVPIGPPGAPAPAPPPAPPPGG